MKTQEELIAGVRARLTGLSEAEIARRLELTPQRWHNYQKGLRAMDDDAIIGCATLLGLDARKLIAAHNAEQAPTPRARTFWLRLSTAAQLAGLTATSTYALARPAWVSALSDAAELARLYIMSNWRHAKQAFRRFQQHLARYPAHESIAPHSFNQTACEAIAAA